MTSADLPLDTINNMPAIDPRNHEKFVEPQTLEQRLRSTEAPIPATSVPVATANSNSSVHQDPSSLRTTLPNQHENSLAPMIDRTSSHASASTSVAPHSQKRPKPHNVFSNDGSFLERLQRTKRVRMIFLHLPFLCNVDDGPFTPL